MNIKELLDWRHDCFFCGSLLEIVPEITGSIGTYSIQDDWMQVESKFIKFMVNIVTGEIKEPEGQEMTIDYFIGGQSLRIKAACLDCYHNSSYYEYSGKVTPLPDGKRSSHISHLEEQLHLHGKIWSVHQYWDRKISHIFLSNPNRLGGIERCKTDFPAIDLKKTTLAQLENKIKTYLVFS